MMQNGQMTSDWGEVSSDDDGRAPMIMRLVGYRRTGDSDSNGDSDSVRPLERAHRHVHFDCTSRNGGGSCKGHGQ